MTDQGMSRQEITMGFIKVEIAGDADKSHESRVERMESPLELVEKKMVLEPTMPTVLPTVGIR